MIPRSEHPKPQFEREEWRNLNGEWDFEIDHGNSGEARGLYLEEAELRGKINVPFCPESKLSGVENTDFMSSVWYKRKFEVTEAERCGRVFIHFGAVDYKAKVYVNGWCVGEHVGGYVSFSFEITEWLRTGENTVTVHAEDDTRSRHVPSGKQLMRYASRGCYYTRTTGIWQTVWLEFTPKTYVKRIKLTPDAESANLLCEASLVGRANLILEATLDGKTVGRAEMSSAGGTLSLSLSLSEKALWEPLAPRLYELKITYGEDVVHSYFGLRKIRIEGRRVLINEKPVFQRLILDQGFYPDGIYTAPSDDELCGDIERAIALGFNGARAHQKVFEERFLYHADRLGYLVWGEYASHGLDPSEIDSAYDMMPEWCEEIERDYNHPCIIGWAPFNETFAFGIKPCPRLIELFYTLTKQLDKTRPVIDASGGIRTRETDIEDTHNYELDEERFASLFEKIGTEEDAYFEDTQNCLMSVSGKPFMVSEYGGVAYYPDGDSENSWGYGNAETEEEFLKKIKALTDIILDNPYITGFCYTQLTDVEQEKNGLYTYDRKLKFSREKLYEIFSRKAAIEK